MNLEKEKFTKKRGFTLRMAGGMVALGFLLSSPAMAMKEPLELERVAESFRGDSNSFVKLLPKSHKRAVVSGDEERDRWPAPKITNRRFSVVSVRPKAGTRGKVEAKSDFPTLLTMAFALKGNVIEMESRVPKEFTPPYLAQEVHDNGLIFYGGCLLKDERKDLLSHIKQELRRAEEHFPGVRILTRNIKYYSVDEMLNARLERNLELKEKQRNVIMHYANFHASNAFIYALGRSNLKVTGGNKIMLENADNFSELLYK